MGRSRMLVGVIGVLVVAVVLTAQSVRADGLSWEGDWVVWEGYLTGEESGMRLEVLDVDLAGFEAGLPDWAHRLLGLCDPAGRFYSGQVGAVGFSGGREPDPVWACEPSVYATGLWWQEYELLGAAHPGTDAAMFLGSDESLFGLGTEDAERAPLPHSPSDRYFWGESIHETPTPQNPQGNRSTSGPNDLHGRCVSGACAEGMSPPTTMSGPPSLAEALSRIQVAPSPRDCVDTLWGLYSISTPHGRVEGPTYSLRASGGDLITVPEGYVVVFDGPGGSGMLITGPGTMPLPCEENLSTGQRIWRFFFPPAPESLPPEVRLRMEGRGSGLKGVGLFNWPPEAGELTIETPHVTTAVLGTVLAVEVDDVDSRVYVFEGAVEVTGVEAGTSVVDAGTWTVSDGTWVADPEPIPFAVGERLAPALDDLGISVTPGSAGVPTPDLAAEPPGPSADGWPPSMVPVLVGSAAVIALLVLGAGRLLGRRSSAASPPPPPP